MRTGAAAGHHGYFHTALCYQSDDEFLATVLPFLNSGVAAGEPALVVMAPPNAALVRSALPAGSGVLFADAVYGRPAGAIRTYRRLLAGHLADGAHQVRIVGEVPAEAATWDAWGRYEAAINHAYDDYPLWSICTYDRRTTPDAVLADVERTHPRLAAPGDIHTMSSTYAGPENFLTEPRTVAPDPAQSAPPVADLADPQPGQARDAVRAVAAAASGQLTTPAVEDLVVAVSEAVTNALLYGRAPVRMRVWTAPARLVVEVSDAGHGPKDPYAGLLPIGHDGPGGRGLWIISQSCDHVIMVRGDEGFTLRMTAGPSA